MSPLFWIIEWKNLSIGTPLWNLLNIRLLSKKKKNSHKENKHKQSEKKKKLISFSLGTLKKELLIDLAITKGIRSVPFSPKHMSVYISICHSRLYSNMSILFNYKHKRNGLIEIIKIVIRYNLPPWHFWENCSIFSRVKKYYIASSSKPCPLQPSLLIERYCKTHTYFKF